MLKWASKSSTLDSGRQNDSRSMIKNEKSDVQHGEGGHTKIPKITRTNGQGDNENLEDLPITPLKNIAKRAISALSLEFPFSARLSSPSIDSGVGSIQSPSLTLRTIIDSPKVFDSSFIKSYSPSHLSRSNSRLNNSKRSRSYLSQMTYLVNMMITLPCLTRYPLAVFKYGGVTFLVAYTVVLVIMGFPSLYLQYNLARLEQKGPVQLWSRLVPLAGGLGTALTSLSLLLSVQYSVITSHSLQYLMASFYSPLPWTQCSTWWGADASCEVPETHRHGLFDLVKVMENSLNISLPNKQASEAAYQQFWSRHVLGGGEAVWIVLVLWLLISVAVLAGGRVVARLQASLAVLLICTTAGLLVKMFLLPGISTTIYTIIQPNWFSLTTPTCWVEAVLIASISTNIHTGTVQAVGSSSTSSRRDHSLVLVLCLAVHMLACMVWSVLTLALAGDLMHDTGLFPLAVLGQALSQTPGGQLGCQAWYCLTATLGIMSVLSSLDAPLSYLKSIQSVCCRHLLVLAMLVTCLIVSLVCALPAGVFILSLLSRWGISLPCLLLGTATTTTLSLIYGLSRATDRIAAHDGCKMHLLLLRYLQLTATISPMVLAYACFSFMSNTTISNGWLITILILCQILAGALLAVIHSLRSSSGTALSWRKLLGCITTRSTREEMMRMNNMASSYRNFDRCDMTMMTELGTATRVRSCSVTGVVNRSMSLSPRPKGKQ